MNKVTIVQKKFKCQFAKDPTHPYCDKIVYRDPRRWNKIYTCWTCKRERNRAYGRELNLKRKNEPAKI